jgi:hypothetical protein
MLVKIGDLKHVLFPKHSRLVHINGDEYSTFIMHDSVYAIEEQNSFEVDTFVGNIANTIENCNGFYLFNQITEHCWFVLSDGGWSTEVEEFFFRAGLIEFLPDKYTLPKDFYQPEEEK